MDIELKKKIEVLLFVHDHPLTLADFQRILGSGHDPQKIEEHLRMISRELALADKPYALEPLAGGWQFLTRPEYNDLIRKLVEIKRQESLTRAQLETLAVVAYSQPITKGDVESIRGVGCAPVLKTLMERGLIHCVGRAKRLGAPPLYATTKRFLEIFGLAEIQEMPERDDILRTFRERLKGSTALQDPADAEAN